MKQADAHSNKFVDDTWIVFQSSDKDGDFANEDDKKQYDHHFSAIRINIMAAKTSEKTIGKSE
jgi:hypothetical protein